MGDSKGFTLIEVLVALFIMSIGFLAISQMQYLSFRQSQLAHSGTTATNMIQAFSDSDLSRMRSIHNLNLALISKIRNGNFTDANDTALKFCKTDLCSNECPCDPFLTISENPDTGTEGNPERICTAIDIENYAFDETIISTNPADSCDDTANKYFLTRTISINIDNGIIPEERTYNIAYSVKNRYQQENSPLELGNSLATHFIKISAHIDTSVLEDVDEDGVTNAGLVIPNIP